MIDEDDGEEQVKESRLLESMDRDKEVAELAQLMQSEEMRDFLWRLLCRCNIFQSTYQRNFGDMALLEGKRQVGLWLLSEICEADPLAEIAMKQKANRLAHEARLKESKKKRRRS